MDKILEKLGIYDLTSVLLSGMIMTFFTLKIVPFFVTNLNIEVPDTLQFLIISYFVGVVFQEMGSMLNSEKLLKAVFEDSKDLRIYLSKKERDYISETVSKEMKSIDCDDIFAIYNFCKQKYLKNQNSIEIDKKQSIAGMARSLFIYCALLSIVSSFGFLFTYKNVYLGFVVGGILLSIIFRRRFQRFIKMRYVSIFRTFYYEDNIKHKKKIIEQIKEGHIYVEHFISKL